MPDQNQDANPEATTPEAGKQVPERRRLLRNIVVVGAMGALGGLLLGEKLPNVAAANSGHVFSGTCNTACACSSTCTVIAGGHTNTASKNYSFVGGGDHNAACGVTSTVGGGRCNTAKGKASTVAGGGTACAGGCYSSIGGGCSNHATGNFSTVAGGGGNAASGTDSTVGGGFVDTASGTGSTVGGGSCNTASGTWATVPGGAANYAAGDYSFAAGRRAKVGTGCPPTAGTHCGTFLFADSTNVNFRSAASNEFAVRAKGGFRFVTAVNSCGNPTQTTAISSSGFLGVGTTTPEAPLTVVSCTSITAALIGSSQGNLIFAKSGTNGFSMYSNAANYLGFYSNDSGIQPLTMNGSGVAVGNAYKSTAPPTNGAIIEGSVGIGTSAPTQTLSVQGTAGKSCGGSTWATFSDRRWKCPDSIQPFAEGLAWVRSLPQPMRFRYAEGNGIGADPGKEHVNFVAQCLLDGVHQGLVNKIQAKVKTNDKEPTTTYAVNVNDMQFAMLNAIKELAEQNAALKEQLAEQKTALREELNEKLTEQDTGLREENKALRNELAEQNANLQDRIRTLEQKLASQAKH